MVKLDEKVTWSSLFTRGDRKTKSWLSIGYEVLSFAIFGGLVLLLKDENGVRYFMFIQDSFLLYGFIALIGLRILTLARDIRAKLQSLDESY